MDKFGKAIGLFVLFQKRDQQEKHERDIRYKDSVTKQNEARREYKERREKNYGPVKRHGNI